MIRTFKIKKEIWLLLFMLEPLSAAAILAIKTIAQVAPKLLSSLLSASGAKDETEALAKNNELNRRLQLLLSGRETRLAQQRIGLQGQELRQQSGQFRQGLAQRESEFGREFGLKQAESRFGRAAKLPGILSQFAQTQGRLR